MKINCWESLYVQIYRPHNRLITEQLINDNNPLYKHAYIREMELIDISDSIMKSKHIYIYIFIVCLLFIIEANISISSISLM